MADVTGLGACAIELNAATGGKLSEEEMEEIFNIVQARRKRLEAEGKIDNLDQRMAEIAAEEGDRARLSAILKRKQTALTILARDRLDAQINELMSGGLSVRKAILAVFEGTVRGVRSGRKSIYATKQAFEARYLGDLFANLEKNVPAARKLLKDKEFSDDVLREIYEFRDGGRPGSTGNKDAAAMARILQQHMEVSRTDLNRLGANIGRLAGYSPQSHDAALVMRVTQDEWIDKTIPRLDLDRSFDNVDISKIREILAETYQTIVTGVGPKLTPARTGQRTGPSNLASGLGKSRVLHFKTADDWIAHADEFSRGNAITSIFDHQRHMANMAAQMQVLGPNPELLMKSVVEKAKQDIRNSSLSSKEKQKQISKLDLESGSLSHALREAQGLTTAIDPGNLTFARINGGLRATKSMASLGESVLSNTGDFVTQGVNMTYHGKGIFSAYTDQFSQMVKAVALRRATGSAEESEIAFLYGEGFDGILDHINSSTFAHDGVPGAISNGMTRFFRWNGLAFFSDAIKSTGVRMMGALMGAKLKKSWTQLDDQLKYVLNQHGINEKHWQVIQQTGRKASNGTTYAIPAEMADLPDEAFTHLIDGKVTENKVARVRLDTELAMRRFFSDELGFGIIEPDARARRTITWGTQPGTAGGEILRNIMQFKGWPIAFTQRVMGRAIYGQRNGLMSMQSAMHIGHLISGLTVAGYMSMTAKDYLKGYDRRSLEDKDGSVAWKTVMAAMAQGGAAGIYGDFLFGEVNRFGGGLSDTLIGPVFGELTNLGDNLMKAKQGDVKAGDWLNSVLGNVPYANLFWARPVLDYLAINSLKESASPGFLARQAAKRRKDFNQTLWHKQEAFPDLS